MASFRDLVIEFRADKALAFIECSIGGVGHVRAKTRHSVCQGFADYLADLDAQNIFGDTIQRTVTRRSRSVVIMPLAMDAKISSIMFFISKV